MLSALKKLRGRRKVIVATHNANVVVNGDADMVIRLDANGWRASARSKSQLFATPLYAQWTAKRTRSIFDGGNTDSEVP